MGKKQTFIVEIQDTQYDSWQGSIEWVQGQKKQAFRSTMELLRLIDTFWQEEHSRNPEGALKNLVYRLRSELRVFGTQELILTLPGAYRWNPEVRLQTDYEEMDALTEAVKKEDMPERKRYLAEKAIALYKKEAPFRASQESWLLSRLMY